MQTRRTSSVSRQQQQMMQTRRTSSVSQQQQQIRLPETNHNQQDNIQIRIENECKLKAQKYYIQIFQDAYKNAMTFIKHQADVTIPFQNYYYRICTTQQSSIC